MSRSRPVDLAPLLAILEARAPRPLTIDELARMANLDHFDRKAIRTALESALAEGRLRRIGKTRYQWRRPEAAPAEGAPRARRVGRSGTTATVEGHYTRVRAGYGFVEVLGEAAARYPRDILIPAGSENGALNGDRVRVEVLRRDHRRQRFAGAVVAVVERVHEHLIGQLDRTRHGWLLIPQSELLPVVRLVGDTLPDLSDQGLVARARLRPLKGSGATPEAELDAVLGSPEDPDVQFLTIASEHGLATEFPPEVLAEADALPQEPSADDAIGREDLSSLPFVTIDGESARDFDDAVCIETREDGGWRVWVAIADVAHYVKPGTALDREARRRGNSVYFPDRAIPMLPARLSSGLCSLMPHRLRLVRVAELEYDRHGHQRSSRTYRAVIRSRARLTYEWVAVALEAPIPPPTTTEVRIDGDAAPLVEQVRQMRGLMKLLYRSRVRAGSLDLDLPESLIDLSEEGRSINVRLQPRNDAHRIIEEMMLEANRVVARELTERGIPTPYRVHEPPHPDSIDELNDFLGPFGVHVEYEETVRPSDLQRALREIDKHRLARVLTRQLLRSLTQAHYSIHNSGHFGLAFSLYCHFTSPIRRYPDLLVSRSLSEGSDKSDRSDKSDKSDWSDRSDRSDLSDDCLHCSQTEREAMAAERAMADLKKAEFMAGHLGEDEPGTIVSITDFGFFVELDRYPIEGLVRAADLDDDRYEFIERERSLRGIFRQRRVRLGDRVVVRCIEASTRRRTIELRLVQFLRDEASETPARRPKPRKKRPQKPAKRATRSR